MSSFVDQLHMADPAARLAAALERLEGMHRAAMSRRIGYGAGEHANPDTHGAAKCVEMAQALIAEYHQRCMKGVESIATLDRAAAIAELEAVLAVWKNPDISDEQWRAHRAPTPVVAIAPRNGVKRRKASAP